MDNFPEITFEFEGKTIKWEKKDFVAIDKKTSIKYVFEGAYISQHIIPCLNNDIVENQSCKLELE